MFRLIQLIQVIFIGYNRDISLTPFDPFPVSPLWFSMLLLSLLFLCACNSWWVHVYVWFRVKSGLLIDCLIPSRLGFPLTYSTFPCLHLHLLDRWGGGEGGASISSRCIILHNSAITFWLVLRMEINFSIIYVVRYIFPVWRCSSSCAN